MKKIVFILALISLSSSIFSQNMGRKKSHRQRYILEQKKYITSYASIDEEQAKVFFTTYFKFKEKRRSLHVQVNRLLRQKKIKQLDNETCFKLLKKVRELNKQLIEAENNYYKEANKIISVKQILLVIKAERKFRLELLKHVRQDCPKRRH